MRGRAFVLASIFAVVGVGGAAPPRVAIFGPDEEPRFSDLARGLRDGLVAHGHATADLIQTRAPRANHAAAAAAVTALAGQRPQVVFVVGSEFARIVRERAPELPIVFITPGDPVRAGLVASLAKPGGNATGVTFEYPELSGKRLQLLTQLAPQARRILAIFDSAMRRRGSTCWPPGLRRRLA